jgi:hypothetical protein
MGFGREIGLSEKMKESRVDLEPRGSGSDTIKELRTE